MTIEPQAITKGLVTESDFQQAKKPTSEPQFLQIVAKPEPGRSQGRSRSRS